MTSLYVHVPWCRSKCRYCAFYSEAADAEPVAFAGTIADEIRARAPAGFAPEAVYIGGGTPSLLGAAGVSALCRALRAVADLSAVREWTFEANPDSAHPATLEAMLAGGATRLSLGAQSFDDATLRFLGRPHDAAAIRRAIAAAHTAGFASVGLDLIAGIPSLSPQNTSLSPPVWRRTLDEALALQPDHVSVYALTVEPGTPLAADVEAGRVQMPPDDAVMDALAEAERVLSVAGLARYEISNYARPGRECLYNLSVWRGEDYLGVGPSASSRLGLERRTNAASIGILHRAVPLPPALEFLSPRADRLERFLTGLRLAEGADPSRAAPEDAARMAPTFRRLAAHGLLESVPGTPNGAGIRWRLTSRGREVADAVARELL